MASKPYPDRRRGTWKMKYRPNPGGAWITVTLGRDPRLKTGSPPKKPPDDLMARADEFRDIEYRAKYGLIAPLARPKALAEYAAKYKKDYPDSHDEGSVTLLNRYLNEFVAWCEKRGLKTLQSITDADCQDYLNFRRKSIAGTTLKTVRGYISGMFSRAVAEKVIQVNPWANAKAGKGIKHKKKPRFWSSEDVAAVVAACRLPWHKDLVMILAHTGIRISATLAMRWAWVDWKEGLIRVPAKHNKGGHEYSVVLSDAAHDILARRLAASKSEFVFAHEDTGEPFTYSGGSAPIERAIARSKVPRGTPHDLRHTFGRWLHLNGVPQAVISAMLGHACIATTSIYVKMEQDDAIKFMRRLAIGSGPAAPKPGGSGRHRASDDSPDSSG